jgi:hypothetical protein
VGWFHLVQEIVYWCTIGNEEIKVRFLEGTSDSQLTFNEPLFLISLVSLQSLMRSETEWDADTWES